MGFRFSQLESVPSMLPKQVKMTESDSDEDSDDALLRSYRGKKKQPKWINATAKQRMQAKREVLALAQKELPVYAGKEAILRKVRANDTIVVLGETGCGKTTQIPQYLVGPEYRHLLNSNQKVKVVVTQPRRVAAISLASRVSEEMGCELGTQVGYTVRFDDCSNSETALKYVTDGTLLQEMLSDRLLSNYDIVILDEAHERSLRTDMLMGFLKSIQIMRKELVEKKHNFPSGAERTKVGTPARPLKLVIMSATLDAERFSEFFDNAKIVYIKGRQHPVTLYYAREPQDDYIESAVKTCLQIHANHPPGDVLVFLAGQEDIENMQTQLNLYADDVVPPMSQMKICPLYAKLPSVQQQQVFIKTPPNTRKFILATNVAETSITIPGVTYVIDCGVAKIKRFHSNAGVGALQAELISQSSANQRSGRAGRESPGKCWRLYTQAMFDDFTQVTEPEIKRCSLSFAVLHLLASGVTDVFQFNFMDPPDTDALKVALIHLHLLGAVEAAKLTTLGRQMAKLPLEPPQARSLVASFENNCAIDMIDLIALLEHSDSLLINTVATRDQAQEVWRRFLHRDGDHMFLLNMLRSYESLLDSSGSKVSNRSDPKAWCREHFINHKSMIGVLKSRQQLRERCKRVGLDWSKSASDQITLEENRERDSEPILSSLLLGFPYNTAIQQQDKSYLNPITRVQVKIHPSSCLQNKGVEAFLYDELVHTTATYARTCSYIKPSWIRNKIPGLKAFPSD